MGIDCSVLIIVSVALLRPAVFLDRDGTLNASVLREGKPYPPASLAEFHLLPGIAQDCARLHAAGYVLVLATNQPDVGRGSQTQAVVESIHAHLQQLIPEIVRIEVCYDPGRGEVSRRRKPEPGMLLDAAAALNLDLRRSWMIGDRWRDVDCGHRAGVRTVFIDLDHREELSEQPDYTVKSFAEATAIILGQGAP